VARPELVYSSPFSAIAVQAAKSSPKHLPKKELVDVAALFTAMMVSALPDFVPPTNSSAGIVAK
jgi:hypothetical protein